MSSSPPPQPQAYLDDAATKRARLLSMTRTRSEREGGGHDSYGIFFSRPDENIIFIRWFCLKQV